MKCLEAITGDMENLAWQTTRFAMPNWKSCTSAMSDLQRQEPRLIAGARRVIYHLHEVLHSTDQSLGRKNRCAKVPTRRDANGGDELAASARTTGTAIRKDPENLHEAVWCKVASPHRNQRATGARIGRDGHIG